MIKDYKKKKFFKITFTDGLWVSLDSMLSNRATLLSLKDSTRTTCVSPRCYLRGIVGRFCSTRNKFTTSQPNSGKKPLVCVCVLPIYAVSMEPELLFHQYSSAWVIRVVTPDLIWPFWLYTEALAFVSVFSCSLIHHGSFSGSDGCVRKREHRLNDFSIKGWFDFENICLEADCDG